jgi:hypothetical protein
LIWAGRSDPSSNPLLYFTNPPLPYIPIPNILRSESRDPEIENSTGDVIPRPSLDKSTIRDENRSDRDPETKVRIRHQMSTQNPLVRGPTCHLSPHTFL